MGVVYAILAWMNGGSFLGLPWYVWFVIMGGAGSAAARRGRSRSRRQGQNQDEAAES